MKRGIHFQEVPEWAKKMQHRHCKLIDPPSENPFPGAEVIGRTYMQDGESSALVMTAEAGAEIWFARFRDQFARSPYILAWEGPNESPVDTLVQRQALTRFEVRRAQRMHDIGKKVIALNCSTWWPRTVDAMDFAPAVKVADYIGLHEYGNPRMKTSTPGNTLHYRDLYAAWRAGGLNPPRLFVTECGQDDGKRHGWKTLSGGDEQVYVDDLVGWYDAQTEQDDDVVAWHVFTAGPQGWGDFVVTESLLKRIYAVPSAPPVDPPVATFAAKLSAAFGAKFSDLHASLEHGPTPYLWRPETAVQRIVVHHSATPATTTWQAIAHYHVATNGWPGIGYHVGIGEDGSVVLLNALTAKSFHCGSAATIADDNMDTAGVCLLGDFVLKPPPTPAAVDALRKVVAVLDAYLGRQCAVIGHLDVAHDTVCPGGALEKLLPGIRGAVDPPVEYLPNGETATDAVTLKVKVRWWTEEALRQHQAGNDARCFAILHDMVRIDGKGLMYRSEQS